MDQGGARGILGPLPSLHRVVPSSGSVKTEMILPYDDVKALLEGAKAHSVRDCICRKEQDLLGERKCSSPMHNCLSFSPLPRSARPGDISREEALSILRQAEEAALVHTVSNVAAGVSYVCNCRGCCCGILRGITSHGLEHSVAAANYRASVDEQACTGCGLCVTGCRDEAVALVRVGDPQIVHPPADYAAWEQERLKNRALT
jgi:hypothetical protein